MTDKLKKYFLIDTTLIILVGIIMVYSSSYLFSKETAGSSTYLGILNKLSIYVSVLSSLLFFQKQS